MNPIDTPVRSVVAVVLTAAIMYFMHASIIRALTFFLDGPPRLTPQGNLLASMTRRVWAYLLLAAFFSFFGTGLSLIPNVQIQRQIRERPVPQIQPLPYGGTPIANLDIQEIGAKLGLAVVGTLLIVSVMRVLIVVYYPTLLRSVIYVIMATSSLAIYTGISDPTYYRNLFDSVFRFWYPDSLPFVAGGSVAVCLLTEYLLDMFPYRGVYPV